MKPKSIVFSLLVIAMLLTPSAVLAKSNDDKHEDKRVASVEVKLKHDDKDDEDDRTEHKLSSTSPSSSPSGLKKFFVHEDEFKIEGTLSAFTDTTLTIGGETVVIDPTKVKEFKQKGMFAVGAKVKVTGDVIDGKKYATDIKVMEGALGHYKVAIKNFGSTKPSATPKASASPSASPISSPSASPSASPVSSPTATASASPSATASAAISGVVELSVKGAASQVVAFLQHVLELLKI